MPREWSGCQDCACTEGRNCHCAAGDGCRTDLGIDELAQLAYNFTSDVLTRVREAIGEAPHVVGVRSLS